MLWRTITFMINHPHNDCVHHGEWSMSDCVQSSFSVDFHCDLVMSIFHAV